METFIELTETELNAVAGGLTATAIFAASATGPNATIGSGVVIGTPPTNDYGNVLVVAGGTSTSDTSLTYVTGP